MTKSQGDPEAQISRVRFHPGHWLICEGRGYSRPQIVSYKKWYSDENWLDWLFDAREDAQRNFVIAADGSSVAWPDLSRKVSAEELMMQRRCEGRIEYAWRQGSLRSVVSRVELIDCWEESRLLRRVDLRPDGSCAQNDRTKGGSQDVGGSTFTWQFTSTSEFVITDHLARPASFTVEGEEGVQKLTSVTHTYQVILFDGKVMELLDRWESALGEAGPIPVWWQRCKRPKHWQPKE